MSTSLKGYALGWVARCPKCPCEVDLESLGWIRINACSWGKRHPLRCPKCDQTRWMRIVHVDEKGNPDQALGLVIRKVMAIWMIVLTIGALIALIVLKVRL